MGFVAKPKRFGDVVADNIVKVLKIHYSKLVVVNITRLSFHFEICLENGIWSRACIAQFGNQSFYQNQSARSRNVTNLMGGGAGIRAMPTKASKFADK